MKRYDFKRDTLFIVLATFDIQMQRMGTLWAEAFLTDDQAKAILEQFPGSITLSPT